MERVTKEFILENFNKLSDAALFDMYLDVYVEYFQLTAENDLLERRLLHMWEFNSIFKGDTPIDIVKQLSKNFNPEHKYFNMIDGKAYSYRTIKIFYKREVKDLERFAEIVASNYIDISNTVKIEFFDLLERARK